METYCTFFATISFHLLVLKQRCNVNSELIKGIPEEKAELYAFGKDFSCLDGALTIPYSYINDDYCDCLDTSDEPGTSACSNGTFYCLNKDHLPLVIPSSRVNDGICDCCDGSDEWVNNELMNNVCQNICKELNNTATKEIMRIEHLYDLGFEIRAQLIMKGKYLLIQKQTMNKCNCESQNCKHNVYIQPPRGVSQQKQTRYVRSNVPMQYESEQKLSYKKYPSFNDASIMNSSTKTNCLESSLKFGFQHSLESTHHSSYRKWKIPNKLSMFKPKNCVDLLGSGPIEFTTTQKFDFQKKNRSEQSKHCGQSCHVLKMNTPFEMQTLYHISYETPKIKPKNILKLKNVYMAPKTKMEMTTTNNSNYKYWIGSLNNSNIKNKYNCKAQHPIEHRTTYNYCYSEPGTYSKGIKSVSDNEDLCIKECCNI